MEKAGRDSTDLHCAGREWLCNATLLEASELRVEATAALDCLQLQSTSVMVANPDHGRACTHGQGTEAGL